MDQGPRHHDEDLLDSGGTPMDTSLDFASLGTNRAATLDSASLCPSMATANNAEGSQQLSLPGELVGGEFQLEQHNM